MSKAKQQAQAILDMANELGWEVHPGNGTVIGISKEIETQEDFVKADSEYYSILSLVPTTSPGSTWGTDGGGVGALSAMKSGVFSMKKSGCSKRVLSTLAKLLN